MNRQLLLISSFMLVLSSCKVGPNYRPPENDVPDEWVSTPTEEKQVCITEEDPPTLWWEIFNDPLLDKYMQLAAIYNKDLLTAETNIFQARAARQVSMAPLFPQISSDYDAFHIFLSKNGPIDVVSSLVAPSPAATKPLTKFNIFNGFIDASWEIDLFGKTRRNVEAAQDQLESFIAQKNDVMVTVFAEIARNYVELRSYQNQVIYLEDNIQILQKNVSILENRYSKGYSNLLDLEQMYIQLNQAVSLLPSVKTGVYSSIFNISVLTGSLPETLLEELLPVERLPEVPDSLATGIRSDILRRRPDIREAERNLAQATATIGVAVASFYPTITLTGIFGLDSVRINNFFSPNSKTWIYGADISTPFFQGGKLIGNLKIAETEAAAMVFTYQQTVLNAVKEAETALVAYRQDFNTQLELKKIVTSNEKLKKLNERRFTKGLTSQLDYLNSELILNNSVLSLVQSETDTLLDVVSLYKALGGGWEAFAVCAE